MKDERRKDHGRKNHSPLVSNAGSNEEAAYRSSNADYFSPHLHGGPEEDRHGRLNDRGEVGVGRGDSKDAPTNIRFRSKIK